MLLYTTDIANIIPSKWYLCKGERKIGKKITPLVSDVYRIYIVAEMALLFDDAFNRTEEEMHSFGFVTVLSG